MGQKAIEAGSAEVTDKITAEELLSPANKRPGADRDQYLAKRHEVLASSAHLVEIDLLRGGQRPPVDDPPACDYRVLVSRAEERPRVGIWPLRLTDRLPVVPIPLRAPDPDAELDLQTTLHEIYDKARYQTYIYDSQPDPPLTPGEEAWTRELLEFTL